VHIEDTSVTGIGEWHHGDLNDLVFGRIKPRRFQVEKDSEFCVAAVRLIVSRWRLKAAENTIVACLFEPTGDFFVLTNWSCSPGAAGMGRGTFSDSHHGQALVLSSRRHQPNQLPFPP
jgi:hypothetical protein